MTHYRISHTTTYDYPAPVSLCYNLAHLTPRPGPGQHLIDSTLAVTPEPVSIDRRIDFFGNPVQRFAIQEPHRRMMVAVTHRVGVEPVPPPIADDTPGWEWLAGRLLHDRTPAGLEAAPFVFDSRHVPTGEQFAAYAAGSFAPRRPVLTAALDLTRRLHSDFAYDPQATTVSTPVDEVLAGRRGVCQDFAHLQLACLRSLGLAARYVSGYLATVPAAGRPRLVGADATHAWVSLFCGDMGWVDLDPTNNLIPGDRHIRLAWGRDYGDVCPLAGVILGGGEHTVRVQVDVAAESTGPA